MTVPTYFVGWSVRSHLLGFASLLLAPLVAPVVLFAVSSYQTASDLQNQQRHEIATRLAATYDQANFSDISTLQTLASSRSLRVGDYATFHARSLATLRERRDSYVIVADGSQQLLNTSIAWGEALPPLESVETITQALMTGRAAISDLFFGSDRNQPLTIITIPVYGISNLTLSLVGRHQIQPQALLGVGLNNGNRAVLIDSKGTAIGHQDQSGAIRSDLLKPRWPLLNIGAGQGHDGNDQEIEYYCVKLNSANWRSCAYIPLKDVNQHRLRFIALLGGIIALSVATALILASWWGRRLAEPIRACSGAVTNLQQGRLVPRLVTSVREVNEVSQALNIASAQLRARAQALVESEARYRAAFEVSAAGMCETDASAGILTRVNQSLCLMLGCNEAELIGRPFTEITYHEDNTLKDYLALINRSIPELRKEKRLIHKDGSHVWVEVTANLVCDQNNKPVRTVALVQNIDDRIHARNRLLRAKAELETRVAARTRELQAALNSSPNAMITTDAAGMIKSINSATTEMFGYSKRDLVGSGLDVLLAEPLKADFIEYCQGVLKSTFVRAVNRKFEGSGIHKNGAVFPLHITIGKYEVGKARFLCASITNLTERNVAEAALRETEQRLAQSQRLEAVGKLTGGVAHDINNVLTIVAASLDLMAGRCTDSVTQHHISSAMNAVQMGAALNKKLLSFARQRNLEPAMVNLSTRLDELIDLVKQMVTEEVTLEFALPPDLWTTFVDPGECDNAILNLIINSRDAMPAGGCLRLEASNVSLGPEAASRIGTAHGGDYVKVCVIDTGHGMPPEVLRRSVEPFFSTKGPGKGTGLGLSAVYGFAKQSGGTLQIESEEGIGTTVSIYLPRSSSTAELARGINGNNNEAARSREISGSGEMILVVEDNDALRDATLKRLEMLGYAVTEARSGKEAIHLIESGIEVALVFSDVVMPGGVTGFDLARWIRASHPSIKVLLTSGYNECPDDEIGVKILAKPYSRQQLAHLIHNEISM